MSSKQPDVPNGKTSRRRFLQCAATLPIARFAVNAFALDAAPSPLVSLVGSWSEEHDLPVFRYTGLLRPSSGTPGISAAYLPDDPYFLLGNHRLTLFAHGSGLFSILSGERAWGRLNSASSGRPSNAAWLDLDGVRIELTGLDCPAANAAGKRFGAGFAEYTYPAMRGAAVTRTISVAPSTNVGEGFSGFVVSVQIHNQNAHSVHATYTEEVRAAYEQIFASWDTNSSAVRYLPQISAFPDGRTVLCRFLPHPVDPAHTVDTQMRSPLEFDPAGLFLHRLDEAGRVDEVKTDDAIHLQLTHSWTVAAGATVNLDFVVGYTRGTLQEAEQLGTRLGALRKTKLDMKPETTPNSRPDTHVSAASTSPSLPYFRELWKSILPAFADEADPALRREMRWHAAVLEQMATWKQIYEETLVPEGMTYDYEWGRSLSCRDWAQHALPLCTTNPRLARSVLRLILKLTTADGEVEKDEQGYGWCESGGMRSSDQQLFLFLLLNEYLRTTGDSTILTESLPWHPLEYTTQATGLEHIERAFLFLRDRIGTGTHGLVRLWNSDWNDMFYFWPTQSPYNEMFGQSESHMNSAMAIVVLGDLDGHLRRFSSRLPAEPVRRFTIALQTYRASMLHAFLEDWGDRPFPRRAYLGGSRVVGEQEMWLEPQGYTLLIPEVPAARKRALYLEIERRLLRSEALGARQIEAPGNLAKTPPGTRENGGFWFSLHGPVVLGADTFDPAIAAALLERVTLERYRSRFPAYWTGQWSATDALNCSTTQTEGLSDWMPYCAHPHAWLLYCYLRLREPRGGQSSTARSS